MQYPKEVQKSLSAQQLPSPFGEHGTKLFARSPLGKKHGFVAVTVHAFKIARHDKTHAKLINKAISKYWEEKEEEEEKIDCLLEGTEVLLPTRGEIIKPANKLNLLWILWLLLALLHLFEALAPNNCRRIAAKQLADVM
jgi:hypothetical protein